MFLNYRKIAEDADRILEVLEKKCRTFSENDSGKRKRGRDMGSHRRSLMNPDIFSVLLDEKGEVILTDTSKIVSIDTENAIEYASEVWARGKEKAIYGSLSLLEDVLWRGDTCYFLRLQETAG